MDSPSPVTTRPHAGSFGSIFRRSSQHIGKSLALGVGGYLPSAMTEMWEPARDFAYVKVPAKSEPVKSVVAMNNSRPQVMLVTSDGFFYVYNIDMEKGGEGVLVQQSSLLENDAGEM